MQQLSLNDNAISDITPLRGMIDMEHLFLSNNQIETIDALRRLHKLKVLRLENNDISDLGAGILDQLEELSLAQNWSLYDVQPLLINAGLGEGDELDLRFTYVRCSDMDTFADKGINLLRLQQLTVCLPGPSISRPIVCSE